MVLQQMWSDDVVLSLTPLWVIGINRFRGWHELRLERGSSIFIKFNQHRDIASGCKGYTYLTIGFCNLEKCHGLRVHGSHPWPATVANNTNNNHNNLNHNASRPRHIDICFKISSTIRSTRPTTITTAASTVAPGMFPFFSILYSTMLLFFFLHSRGFFTLETAAASIVSTNHQNVSLATATTPFNFKREAGVVQGSNLQFVPSFVPLIYFFFCLIFVN